MTDEQTNESDTGGNNVDKPMEKKEKPVEENTSSPLLDRAKAENDRREKLIEEDKKLQDRKEKLYAEQLAGGRAEAGSETKPKEETPKEYRERIEKEMKEGKEDGFS